MCVEAIAHRRGDGRQPPEDDPARRRAETRGVPGDCRRFTQPAPKSARLAVRTVTERVVSAWRRLVISISREREEAEETGSFAASCSLPLCPIVRARARCRSTNSFERTSRSRGAASAHADVRSPVPNAHPAGCARRNDDAVFSCELYGRMPTPIQSRVKIRRSTAEVREPSARRGSVTGENFSASTRTPGRAAASGAGRDRYGAAPVLPAGAPAPAHGAFAGSRRGNGRAAVPSPPVPIRTSCTE